MIDTTIKTYATRQFGGLALAGLFAALLMAAVSFIGGTQARTPAGGIKVPGAVSTGRPIFSGPARVIDGDTIVVGQVRVRLEGIDAPETSQSCLTRAGQPWSCGAKASHVLARIIGEEVVTCEDLGLDKYGRTLGTCHAGTVNLNAEMVRLGFAWAFVRYSLAYVTLEKQAREARAGIWEGDATPAWDYRAGRWETAEPRAPEGCAIKGNVTASGRIYHMPWSPWYDKVKMDNSRGKRWFCSENEAIAAGWRPALSQ